MRKLAVIRTNNDNPCPFGLPIPFGCTCAGKYTENMAPLDIMEKMTQEEKDLVSSANTKLLAHELLNTAEKPEQCRYVGHILDKKEVTECNYDDTAPGQGPGQSLATTPSYSKMFEGGINGIRTAPAGYFSDYNVSQNSYLGILSYQGNKEEDLIKMAKEILGG
jgi:hypothetical protein